MGGGRKQLKEGVVTRVIQVPIDSDTLALVDGRLEGESRAAWIRRLIKLELKREV